MKSLPISEPTLTDILLRHQLITETELVQAEALQETTGSPLCDVLINNGMVACYDMYRCMAQWQGLAFANLLKELPDAELLQADDADLYIKLRALPWKMENSTVIVAACEITDEVLAFARLRF
jgi:hypothetical protein